MASAEASRTRAYELATARPSRCPRRRRRRRTRAAGRDEVHERRRERNAPDADPVESRVQAGVDEQAPERDGRRDPGGLEAEEGPVEHEHDAVEGETEGERRQSSRDDGGLLGCELPPLVEQPGDRQGERRGDRTGREEHEPDLPEPERHRPAKLAELAHGRVAGERGRARSRSPPRRPPAAACRSGTPRRSRPGPARGRSAWPAKKRSTTRLTLMSPRPSATGSMSTKTRSRPGRASRPARGGGRRGRAATAPGAGPVSPFRRGRRLRERRAPPTPRRPAAPR